MEQPGVEAGLHRRQLASAGAELRPSSVLEDE